MELSVRRGYPFAYRCRCRQPAWALAWSSTSSAGWRTPDNHVASTVPSTHGGQPARNGDLMVELPASIRLETGKGGLPVLRIDGPAAEAEIYLHGATVTKWAPRGGGPVLWVSRASRFAAMRRSVAECRSASHGSGRWPVTPNPPSHGFARLSEWSIVRAENDGQDVIVRLRLTDQDITVASPWPYRFEAISTVVVGAQVVPLVAGHQPRR